MQKMTQNATATNGGYDTKNPIFIGSIFFSEWHGDCIIVWYEKRNLYFGE